MPKPFDKFCNKDELQFQVVHQVEELWMKLIAYTLLDRACLSTPRGR